MLHFSTRLHLNLYGLLPLNCDGLMYFSMDNFWEKCSWKCTCTVCNSPPRYVYYVSGDTPLFLLKGKVNICCSSVFSTLSASVPLRLYKLLSEYESLNSCPISDSGGLLVMDLVRPPFLRFKGQTWWLHLPALVEQSLDNLGCLTNLVAHY